MPPRLARILTGILLAAVLAFPADWAIWRVRAALDRTGAQAMDTVEVDHVTIASLKASKEEYYDDGTATVSCSRSLFPQAGAGACWWLRRHALVIARP